MGETTQEFVAAIFVDDRLRDDTTQAGHAFAEPSRDAPAVERQIG
jgi:hypothetical protein